LRSFFNVYGTIGITVPNNKGWRAVTDAIKYFLLVTDFFLNPPMSDQMKAAHRAQLHNLAFKGPALTTQFLL
jgi:hypothetical protein